MKKAKRHATRGAAIEAGAMHYFTGKPCRNGHISHRFTLNGTCARCALDANTAVLREIKRKRALAAGKSGG